MLRGLFFQAWGSLKILKFQIRDPQLKFPPGGLVLMKKSIDLTRVWTREPWISRRARYPETTEADCEMDIETRVLVYRQKLRRGGGRPKLRWLNDVRENLRKFDVKNWWTGTEDGCGRGGSYEDLLTELNCSARDDESSKQMLILFLWRENPLLCWKLLHSCCANLQCNDYLSSESQSNVHHLAK